MSWTYVSILSNQTHTGLKPLHTKLKIKKYGKELKMQLNYLLWNKFNSKAFSLPILTVSAVIMFDSDSSHNRDRIYFKIKFCSIATIEFHLQLVSILFDFYLVCTLF